MLDEQQRLAQIAIENRITNEDDKEFDKELDKDAEDDYKEGLKNGRQCPRCQTIFKSNYTFKNHIFNRKIPCTYEKKHNTSTNIVLPNTYNNTYTTTTIKNGKTTRATINGQNISELVKNGNLDILSKMGNMANFGTNTHTRQTVNQLNANSVRIVPPSQDDLDMVVKYIYDKFINEFEEYKQEKIEGYKREMIERQKIYLAEKEQEEKQKEQQRLELEKIEQLRIQKEREDDLAKLSKIKTKGRQKK
jgi:hypothetical protein